MLSLIIVGAGGFGLEVAAYAEDMTKSGNAAVKVQGFLDDVKAPGTVHGGYPVLGGTDGPIDPQALYVIAVGAPQGRKKLAEKLIARQARFATIIHPSAYVGANACIGEGAILAPFTFVGPEGKVGPHALLNIYASVGHEAVLGPYSALAPYAGLHGQAATEEGVFLGAQSNLTAGINMGAFAKLAAGAIAYTDIPAAATALGNPAKFRSSE